MQWREFRNAEVKTSQEASRRNKWKSRHYLLNWYSVDSVVNLLLIANGRYEICPTIPVTDFAIRTVVIDIHTNHGLHMAQT